MVLSNLLYIMRCAQAGRCCWLAAIASTRVREPSGHAAAVACVSELAHCFQWYVCLQQICLEC
jgi:hypothetical protein